MSHLVFDDENGMIIEERRQRDKEPKETIPLRCPTCGCTKSAVIRDENGKIDVTLCCYCSTETTYELWQ